MNHRTGARLKVAVRIAADMRTAHIAVLGLVTPLNVRALSVIVRRTIALLPGREIVLDLTHARAAQIEELNDPRQFVRLVGGGHDPAHPCPLRILNPATQEQPCMP
jgi:hypothetical protein